MIVFVINIIAAFLGYLIRIVLARNLTVAEYGLFFSVFTLMSFLGVFISLGTNESIVKYIPEFLVKKQHSKVKSALLITAVCTLATVIVFSIIIFFLSQPLANHYFRNPLAEPVLLLFIAILLFVSFKGMLRQAFQALQDMRLFSFMYLAENSLLLIMLFAAFAFSQTIFSAAYVYIAVNLLLIMIFTLFLKKSLYSLTGKASIDKKVLKDMVKFGIFVIGSNIGGIMILYTDTLVLTYFRSLAEVGVYNAVVPTVMMIQFFATSIVTVIFPMVSELWAKKKKDYLAKGLGTIYQYSFAIMIPAVIIALAFSEPILGIMFGPDYIGGAIPMQLLLVGIVFFGLYSITSAALNGIGKPAISTKILLQGALLNLILNLLLIPTMGMLGAALSSLISYVFTGIYSSLKLARFIEIRMPWLSWLKTVAIGIIMLLLIIFLSDLLVMNVYAKIIMISAIAGILYLVLVIIAKVIDLKELVSLLAHIVK